MRPNAEIILIIAALAAFGGPLILGLLGLFNARSRSASSVQSRAGWDWRLTLASALLYALAFNLVFFLQELFLVWPKALTPGLEPVLYHNNHGWTGGNPLARLFQGTGALAILVTALAALWWLKRRPGASASFRLFAIWVAFSGLFQSLPQVVTGAVLPQNDVGMAMDYLGFSPPAMAVAVVAALIAMAVAGMGLARPFLALAGNPAQVSTRRGRTGFLFQVATLPAVLGVALILPFRVPGAIDQVVMVPVAATLIGIVWVQANGWRIEDVRLPGNGRSVAILRPSVLLVAVLLVFQLILRPGIAF